LDVCLVIGRVLVQPGGLSPHSQDGRCREVTSTLVHPVLPLLPATLLRLKCPHPAPHMTPAPFHPVFCMRAFSLSPEDPLAAFFDTLFFSVVNSNVSTRSRSSSHPSNFAVPAFFRDSIEVILAFSILFFHSRCRVIRLSFCAVRRDPPSFYAPGDREIAPVPVPVLIRPADPSASTHVTPVH